MHFRNHVDVFLKIFRHVIAFEYQRVDLSCTGSRAFASYTKKYLGARQTWSNNRKLSSRAQNKCARNKRDDHRRRPCFQSKVNVVSCQCFDFDVWYHPSICSFIRDPSTSHRSMFPPWPPTIMCTTEPCGRSNVVCSVSRCSRGTRVYILVFLSTEHHRIADAKLYRVEVSSRASERKPLTGHSKTVRSPRHSKIH